VSHPLMVLAAPALAAAKFRMGGAGAVILVAILVLAIAAIAVFAVQRSKRSRSAPPDDWERDQARHR
jgi:lipopolysaccharide export LptBFGC system permease protein LptF